MKFYLRLLRLVILALFSFYSINSYASVLVDSIYYAFGGDTAIVSGAICKHVKIPSEVACDGKIYRVTSIDGFYDNDTIESISIPASVNSLIAHDLSYSSIPHPHVSFRNCKNLKSVRFEDGATPLELGQCRNGWNFSDYIYMAFYGCSNIEELYIGRNLSYVDYNYKDKDKYGYDIEIYGGMLFEKSSLVKVAFGPYVTVIHPRFLKNQYGLVDVDLGSKCTNIGAEAFYGCNNLQSVNLSGTQNQIIGRSAFKGCSRLENLSFSDCLTTVGDSAFYGISTLTKLNFPNTTYLIGRSAFQGCTGITEISFGNGLKSIGNCAFKGCSSLTAIILPDGCTTMGNGAFSDCRKLTYASLGSSLTAVPSCGFKNCIALSEMNVPQTATSIGSGAFYNDSTLAAISMKEGLKTIGDTVFYNNSGITSFTIPSTVTSIGKNSFYGCTNTVILTFKDGTETLTIDNTDCRSRKIDDLTTETTNRNRRYDYFYDCPIRTLKLGRNLLFKSSASVKIADLSGNSWVSHYRSSGPFAHSTTLKKVTIGSNVTAICNHMFDDCDLLKSVNFPEGLYSIGAFAFYDCDGLTSIEFPASLNSIGNYAFANIDNLPSVTFKESASDTLSIGDGAFQNDSLVKVTLPSHLSRLGSYAFSGCTRLNEVIFNESDSYKPSLAIGQYAFKGCSLITVFDFPGRLTNIDNFAFTGCQDITYLTFKDGDGIVKLGYGKKASSIAKNYMPLFGDCKLKNLYIGKNIEYADSSLYGYSPFYAQDSLKTVTFSQAGTVTKCYNNLLRDVVACTSLTLPESLDTIGNYAFCGMKSLATISIPNKVTSIGTYAFSNDTSLLSAKLSAGCDRLKTGLFYDCGKLQAITIPAAVTKIDDSVFGGCTSLADVNLEDGAGMIETGYGSSATPNLFTDCPIENLYLGRRIYYSTYSPFYSKKTLKKLTIGKLISVVDKNMFSYCTGIENVYLPDNITTVGLNAFRGCTALKTLRLSDKLTELGEYGFSECTSLDSVAVPESLTSLSNNSFSNCTSLKTLDLGKKLQVIGPSVFENDSALQSIDLPETLYGLGVASFKNCKSLPNVTVKGISSVGKQAFQGCTGLQCVTLSAKTTSLGENSFDGCTGIVYVKSYPETPPEGLANFPEDVVANGTLFVPETAIDDYKDSPSWEDWYNVRALTDDVLVTSIKFDKDSVSLKAAESVTITATVDPEDAVNKSVVWTSANETIATVDAAGVVTGVATGETDITATAADGSGIKAVCHITVMPTLVTSIELSKTELSVKKGRTASLSATVLPAASDNKALTWTSSDTTVATVDSVGNIKALLAGTAIIKASATDGSGISAECKLTVTGPLPGDSNDDDMVNVVDAVNTVNYILHKNPSTFVFEAADVNGDGRITVSDVTGAISHILSQAFVVSPMAAPNANATGVAEDVDNLVFSQEENSTIGVALDNASSYVAMQADITLPVNAKDVTVTLSDALAATHQLEYAQIAADKLRVVVYSLENSAFVDGEDLFTITSGNTCNVKDAMITNALAADAEANGYKLSTRYNAVTSIEGNVADETNSPVKVVNGGIEIHGETGDQVNIYNVGGMLIDSFSLSMKSNKIDLPQGIYFVTINGTTTKVIIK